MEQILALPWHGPLERELLEEAALTCGKSIFIASSVRAIVSRNDKSAVPSELMIIDSTWAPGLLMAIDTELHSLAEQSVPTILTQCQPSSAAQALDRKLNIVATISPLEEFTSRLPQLICGFFELRANLAGGVVQAAHFQPLVETILDQPARDNTFFRRALRRQEASRHGRSAPF